MLLTIVDEPECLAALSQPEKRGLLEYPAALLTLSIYVTLLYDPQQGRKCLDALLSTMSPTWVMPGFYSIILARHIAPDAGRDLIEAHSVGSRRRAKFLLQDLIAADMSSRDGAEVWQLCCQANVDAPMDWLARQSEEVPPEKLYEAVCAGNGVSDSEWAAPPDWPGHAVAQYLVGAVRRGFIEEVCEYLLRHPEGTKILSRMSLRRDEGARAEIITRLLQQDLTAVLNLGDLCSPSAWKRAPGLCEAFISAYANGPAELQKEPVLIQCAVFACVAIGEMDKAKEVAQKLPRGRDVGWRNIASVFPECIAALLTESDTAAFGGPYEVAFVGECRPEGPREWAALLDGRPFTEARYNVWNRIQDEGPRAAKCWLEGGADALARLEDELRREPAEELHWQGAGYTWRTVGIHASELLFRVGRIVESLALANWIESELPEPDEFDLSTAEIDWDSSVGEALEDATVAVPAFTRLFREHLAGDQEEALRQSILKSLATRSSERDASKSRVADLLGLLRPFELSDASTDDQVRDAAIACLRYGNVEQQRDAVRLAVSRLDLMNADVVAPLIGAMNALRSSLAERWFDEEHNLRLARILGL